MGTYELEETSAGRAGGLRKRAAACLLDHMARAAGCMYLSDLRGGGPVRFRRAMIAAVNRLTPEDAELREWNDALEYLADAPKERTAHAAREKLLAYLSGHSQEQLR